MMNGCRNKRLTSRLYEKKIKNYFLNNKAIINKKFYVYVLGLDIDEQDT